MKLHVRLFVLLAVVFWWSEAIAVVYCQSGTSCQCVDYCKDNGWADFSGLGYAKNWFGAAARKGYTTGSTPKKGAVIVLDSWGSNPAGHVAIVQGIVSGSEIIVDHSNWSSSGETNDTVYYDVSVKDVSASGNWSRVSFYGSGSYPVLGFIYQRGISSESDNACDPFAEKCTISRNGSVGWFPPVRNCRDADQWFIMGIDSKGNQYPMGSRPDNSACPTNSCSMSN